MAPLRSSSVDISHDQELKIPDVAKGEAEDVIKNATSHLSLCENAIVSQENLNREFSRKALGIITFSIALFGFGVRWGVQSDIFASKILVLLLSACASMIAFMGIFGVVKPGTWMEPRRLSFFQEIAFGANHTTYLRTLADTYGQAFEDNISRLKNKGKWLKTISCVALIQLVIFTFLGWIFILTD